MTEATIERAKEKPSGKREQMYEGQKEANIDALELRGGDCDWHQQSPGEKHSIKLDRTGWQGPDLLLRPRRWADRFIPKTMGGH